MAKCTGTLILLVIIAIALFCGILVEIYKYKDCKKVGHTALYCWLNAGK